MLRRTTALAGLFACAFVSAAQAEPKTNLLHQWSEGADAAAIAKLGEMFTAAGGKWEQTSISGHTANTLAKLRADVVAGNCASRRSVEGAGDRRMERDRQDRQSRRSRARTKGGTRSSPLSFCRS